jgi:YHS domain-containing protein
MIRRQRFALLRRLLMVAVWVGFLGFAAPGSAVAPIIPVNTANGLALKGYDPVAYFTTGPTPGVERYSYLFKGATYRFASAENLERFKADPEKYLPQYGGYCAYAMSINRIADINPTDWAVVDNKLYLNNNVFVQALWSLDKRAKIASADRNWAALPKTTQ